jgi:hypothetical protein
LTHKRILSAKEGHMRRHIDTIIRSLLLVRIGQELGSDSELARAVAQCIDAAVSAASRCLG